MGTATAGLLLLLASTPPGGPLADELRECSRIKIDGDRLACYDKIVAGLDGEADAGAGVTLANFNRLEDGMSYAEVVKILGGPGEPMSRSTVGGTVTEMYGWKAGGGANMNAMFQDGKLIQKSQFGLR